MTWSRRRALAIGVGLAALFVLATAWAVLHGPMRQAWLLRQLEGDDEKLALAAAEELVERGCVEALPALIRFDVRWGPRVKPDGVDDLTPGATWLVQLRADCVHDPSYAGGPLLAEEQLRPSFVSLEAAERLRAVDAASVHNLVTELCLDESAETRTIALLVDSASSSEFGRPRALLETWLSHDDVLVRAAAVDRLWLSGGPPPDPDHLARIVVSRFGGADRLRYTTLWRIVQLAIQENDPLPDWEAALFESLQSDSVDARAEAALAWATILDDLPDFRTLDLRVARRVFGDEDPRVRAEALAVLRRQLPLWDDTASVLGPALESGHEDVIELAYAKLDDAWGSWMIPVRLTHRALRAFQLAVAGEERLPISARGRLEVDLPALEQFAETIREVPPPSIELDLPIADARLALTTSWLRGRIEDPNLACEVLGALTGFGDWQGDEEVDVLCLLALQRLGPMGRGALVHVDRKLVEIFQSETLLRPIFHAACSARVSIDPEGSHQAIERARERAREDFQSQRVEQEGAQRLDDVAEVLLWKRGQQLYLGDSTAEEIEARPRLRRVETWRGDDVRERWMGQDPLVEADVEALQEVLALHLLSYCDGDVKAQLAGQSDESSRDYRLQQVRASRAAARYLAAAGNQARSVAPVLRAHADRFGLPETFDALGRLGIDDEPTRSVLRRALEDVEKRLAALQCLRRLPSAVRELENAVVECFSDVRYTVHLAAVDVLCSADAIGEDSIPVLVECLNGGPWRLREEVARALGRARPPMKYSTRRTALEALRRLNKDPDRRVRWQAARSLQRLEAEP